MHGVVGAFANDKRIVAWDVWNEPASSLEAFSFFFSSSAAAASNRVGSRGSSLGFSPGPAQLFSTIFTPIGPEKRTPVTEIQLAESDVLSFHNYSWGPRILKNM